MNGYDEKYRGWGCEDDDLRLRLRQAGMRINSILRWTHTYHQWHEPDPTAPDVWNRGANVSRLQRSYRLTRCVDGLSKRRLTDLNVRFVGSEHFVEHAQQLFPFTSKLHIDSPELEMEILVNPADGITCSKAQCNVLLLLDGGKQPRKGLNNFDVIISDQSISHSSNAVIYSINEFKKEFFNAA